MKKVIMLLTAGIVLVDATLFSSSYSIFNSTRNDSAPTKLSAVPVMNSATVPAANLYPDSESNPGTHGKTGGGKCYLPVSLIISDLTDFPQAIGPQTVLLIREGLLETNFAHICTIIGADLYLATNGQYNQNSPLLSYHQPQKGTVPLGQTAAGTVAQYNQSSTGQIQMTANASSSVTPANSGITTGPLNNTTASGSGQPKLKTMKRTFLKDYDDNVTDNYFQINSLAPGTYVLILTVAEINNTSNLLPPFVTQGSPIHFTVLDPNDPNQNAQLCRIEKNEEDTSVS